MLNFIEAGQVGDALTGAARNAEVLKRLTDALGDTDAGKLAVADLETITAVLDALGKSDNWTLDTSVVRGLGYYTGRSSKLSCWRKRPMRTARPSASALWAGAAAMTIS